MSNVVSLPAAGIVMVSWEAVNRRATALRVKYGGPRRVFGVPRGGAVAAALVGTPVDHPTQAEYIVDDVIDSGATRSRYRERFPALPFEALFDKTPGGADEGAWLSFPWETEDESRGPTDAVTRILQYIGENPEREGLLDTPARVIRAWDDLTVGYRVDIAKLLERRFTDSYDEMVVVKKIPFWSLCEHHLLPFHGWASVGYIPNGHVVGLSKIPRLVDAFSRRLQLQERLTSQIATALEEHLNARGVGVVLSASHTCMAMRGVQIDAPTVTSALLGVLREPAVREEFLRLATA